MELSIDAGTAERIAAGLGGCHAYCLVSMARHSEPEPRLGTIMRCEARRIAAKIAKLPELLPAMSAFGGKAHRAMSAFDPKRT